ncbi:MAG: putative Ig domain-containing protein, partial [candidate division Zixibacteria bacterium]|nr:putative Ig domain-containing protein [candidate division Zixibacteria bacterium]
ASDGLLADSELVTITVLEAGNQRPLLSAIGPQSVTEGINLSFGASASDPDATTPALSAVSLPTGASFTDNADGTGTFGWTPTFVQSGSFNVTFIATDGLLADSEVVTITVNEAGNQSPTLTTIGPQSVVEGINLNLALSASDPDGTIPAIGASTLPPGATFTDNGDGSAVFDWTPDFTQSGSFFVIFFATDGVATDSEVVSITVNEAGNQSPILALIGPQSVSEGINLNFGVSSSDADGTFPALSAAPLPAGASFTDNGNGTGTFNWTPDFTQAGIFNVAFVATDGLAPDSELVVITVISAGNQIPALAAIGAKSVTEGANLAFPVSATDLDGTIPSVNAANLPAGASFIDNGDGTGAFDWTPDFTQSGTFIVTFFASDGLANDTEFVTISVNEAGNQTPVLAAIGPQSGTEGIILSFGVSATDADGTTPALSATNLPAGAGFINNGNGTGTFSWTPEFTQSGAYTVTFTAFDGLASASEIVAFTISESGNQTPVLAFIGAQSITEGAVLSFGVSSSDPDGTFPSLSAAPLPSGASFTDNGDGTGSFSWTPTFVQAGVFLVTFAASDGVATDNEVVTITVIEAGNQPPVLAAIGPQSVNEGANLNFAVTASDADGTFPALSAVNTPAGAVFIDNGDGTGAFSWTPDFTQSGAFSVTFFANDGLASDSEIVSITVSEVGNQAPVLAAIGSKVTTENVNLNFVVTASDPDATVPALSASALPPGAAFTDNGNGTATFDWTPDFTQSGTYNITFIASDGSAADSEVVTISVTEAGNQTPVLSAIGPQSTT